MASQCDNVGDRLSDACSSVGDVKASLSKIMAETAEDATLCQFKDLVEYLNRIVAIEDELSTFKQNWEGTMRHNNIFTGV
jgi:hypothetical protein